MLTCGRCCEQVSTLCNEYWMVEEGKVVKSDSPKAKINDAAHGQTAD